jgi:ATPase
MSSTVRTVGEEVFIPDSTVVANGVLRRLLMDGAIKGRILIPRELIKYFEELAREGRTLGYVGLEELRLIRTLCITKEVNSDIISLGRRIDNVDSAVRDYALETGATLITSSKIQSLAAESLGIKVLYKPPIKTSVTVLEKFFDRFTMSVHLKEGARPAAKKGMPGRWKLVQLDDTELSREDLETIADEILELAKTLPDAVIEVDRMGSTIVQLGDFRVIITRPPMSDGWEITAVRPLAKPVLEDYKLPDKLVRRLEKKAEGILIAGAPGMGKTTFAQALAEYYTRENKIVKTIESPRDMRLPAVVTQYSKVYATPDELHDILLLSRPDYTVFDEMRTDEDFKLYVDLRLAGIGMIGVVHATSPIDAVQRFLRRVDLGMIPSIIDTVIFIENGQVNKVYELAMTVKLPTGLREADLARPVVEVRDFLTGNLEYEIYTFGEQTVVVPVRGVLKTGLEYRLRRIFSTLLPTAEVRMEGATVHITVPKDDIKSVRKLRRKLRKIEDEYGVKINLRIV